MTVYGTHLDSVAEPRINVIVVITNFTDDVASTDVAASVNVSDTNVAPYAVRDSEVRTRVWANAQRDGRPAEYRWRPLFNAAV